VILNAFFLLAGVLHAQPLSYGVKLGTPLNDPVRPSPDTTSSPARWMGGPFVELHLPLRLSVEFSALYRTHRESATRVFPTGSEQHPYLFTSTDKVQTWDFPLLAKYRFTDGKIRPFIGAGGAWTHRRSDFQSFASCLGPAGSCRNPAFPIEFRGGVLESTLTKFGPAASAGVDFKTRYVTIAPEVRWNRVFSGGPTRDQVSVMVGLSFGR
jgi:hypothetical protein